MTTDQLGIIITIIFGVAGLLAAKFIFTNKSKAKNNSMAFSGNITAQNGGIAGQKVDINITDKLSGTDREIKPIELKNPEVCVYKFEMCEGEYQEIAGEKLEVKQILEIPGENNEGKSHEVILYCQGAFGGDYTRKVSSDYYCVPVMNDNLLRARVSIYSYRYMSMLKVFTFFSASITHINPFKRVVTVEIVSAKTSMS